MSSFAYAKMGLTCAQRSMSLGDRIANRLFDSVCGGPAGDEEYPRHLQGIAQLVNGDSIDTTQ